MNARFVLPVLFLTTWLQAAAAELVTTPAQHLILKPPKPVVIDGRLDEWPMARTPYIITASGKDPMNDIRSNDATNPVKGDADLSGRAALAWDEQYLYVAGEMTDDHLMGVKPDSSGNQGPPGWGCDSLMVTVASFRQPMKTNSPFSPTPCLALRYAPTGANPRGTLVPGGAAVLDNRDFYWVLTEHSKWAVTETPRGYNVEAAIPWKDLDFVARPGERLFIAFLAADVDPGEALNQVGWGFKGDPKDHPLFRLADRADVLGDVTVSADQTPTNRSFAIRATLDAVTGPARLEAIRVVNVEGGPVVDEKIGSEVPPGKTLVTLRDFPAGAIPKPGNYTVALTASAGGKTSVVARAPLRIVEPQPQPPRIRNLPGEIHHMGPDRVAHNAYGEHRVGFYRHGWVKSKEDYVPYIRRHVEPGLKAATRSAIQTKNPWGYVDAFRCMALHRLTQDAEYAQLARDTMDYTLAAGDLGWFKLTAVAQYRYLTWKQDPASPFTPPRAEERYRANLHKIAAQPDQELFAESGTHNRVWHRYALLKIARQVAEADGKPVDPRIREYTDYHDRLIGAVGDTDDASAGYHWVFFDAAAALYFHTGDWEAFLRHKGFRKTLARYVEMVSPSGACPPFASCSGWPEVGASLWAYEWMSRLTKDGRFRWTSHRIAEYYYNHLDHRANQYHGPYDTARANFVMGYLLADDSVPPQPPPGVSRLTWRHPWEPVPLDQLRARPGTSPMAMVPDRWIPDKVILTSGNDPQSLWGLVELLPTAGHGGEVPGNLIALMQHDAALLAGQGYYENTPNFQNLLWIEDLDGLAADPRPMATEVPAFVDDPAFTWVRIRTTAYQHLPVTYTRDLVFCKNGFLVVKDRAKFDSTMKVRLGPCFQTRNLGPQCGENWFNAYYDDLYYTGLGLGRGVQAIRNPAWDLLVYFTPRPGRTQTVVDRYLENPYRCSPVQLRQVWSGMVRAGQEISFTSVLLPHAPTFTPQDLVEPPADSKDPKRIEVLQDDDQVTVLKGISETDPWNKIRFETWVLLNETGKSVKAGPVESDAAVAVVGLAPDGTIQNRAVAGGSALRFRDRDEWGTTRKLRSAPAEVPEQLLK
jgi:hypothetical protein